MYEYTFGFLFIEAFIIEFVIEFVCTLCLKLIYFWIGGKALITLHYSRHIKFKHIYFFLGTKTIFRDLRDDHLCRLM